jgi:hypothetical protein
MGAVSALVDVKGPEATKALEDAAPNLMEKNRELAKMRKAKLSE